jgi:hypothetical protein
VAEAPLGPPREHDHPDQGGERPGDVQSAPRGEQRQGKRTEEDDRHGRAERNARDRLVDEEVRRSHRRAGGADRDP